MASLAKTTRKKREIKWNKEAKHRSNARRRKVEKLRREGKVLV